MNTIKTTDTLSTYISHVAAGKTDAERPSRLPYVMLKKSRKWKSVASFNNQRLEHCIYQWVDDRDSIMYDQSSIVGCDAVSGYSSQHFKRS